MSATIIKTKGTNPQDNVLLFSGGLDSLIAYFYLDRPITIFADMKQKYAKTEINRVKVLDNAIGMNVVYETRIFDFHEIEEPDLTIPYRNMFLAMLGSLYGSNVWMAAVNGDYNHDKTPEIFDKMGGFMTELSGRKIKIDSPFWDMTKTEMIAWYLKQNLPEDWLKKSYSCFEGENMHCGRCSSCLRRWVAMINNGICEEYERDPITWDVIPNYISRFINETNPKDTQKRREEFIQAMFKVGYKVPKTNVKWVEALREIYI